MARWSKPHYPFYFFDWKDLPEKYLSENTNYTQGESQYKTYDVVVGEQKAIGAATQYVKGELSGLIMILFGAMDAWFEEDEQIYVHPKDPYKVRTSSLLTRALVAC